MKDPRWLIRSRQFERLTIEGPKDDFVECLKRLFDEGYSTKVSGAYTNRKMHPQIDPDRFLIIAEKELNEAE